MYHNHDIDHLLLANTINSGTRDAITATNLTGVAGIKETADSSRDNIRETSRVASDLSHDIFTAQLNNTQQHSDSRSAVERTSGEGRLQASLDARAILTSNRDVGDAIRGDLKDNATLILTEACKTREKTAEQFAALQVQHGELKLQMCKDHADIKLQMCQDHAALSAKIDKCCCEQSKEAAETRALILSESNKRTEADLAAARQELLFAKLSSNGPGNSGN